MVPLPRIAHDSFHEYQKSLMPYHAFEINETGLSILRGVIVHLDKKNEYRALEFTFKLTIGNQPTTHPPPIPSPFCISAGR